jgi:hypothetical protein
LADPLAPCLDMQYVNYHQHYRNHC